MRSIIFGEPQDCETESWNLVSGSQLSAFDHTIPNAPDTIRTQKLNGIGPSQYFRGGPEGNPWCWMQPFLFTKFFFIIILCLSNLNTTFSNSTTFEFLWRCGSRSWWSEHLHRYLVRHLHHFTHPFIRHHAQAEFLFLLSSNVDRQWVWV